MGNEIEVADDVLNGNNAIAKFESPQVVNPYDAEFDNFVVGAYLPRIQLEGSNSDLVKFNKIPKGHYSFIKGKKDDFIDLGASFDCLVLGYRTKAMEIENRKPKVIVYDKNNPEFKRIQGESRQGFMWGLEFLLYVPDVENEIKYATFFMGNPTMRVEAKNFGPIIKAWKDRGKEPAATLKSKILQNDKGIWEAPDIYPCSSGLSNYPPKIEMEDRIAQFYRVPKDVVGDEEVVEDVPAASDRG